MLKVLFVHGQPRDQMLPFVEQDLDLLQMTCEVEVFSLAPFQRKFIDPLISQAVRRAVARNDLIFGWFGQCSPIVIIAKLYHKPVVLVGGGIDVVKIPEIGYGLVTHKALMTTLLGFRLADRVLLFSDSSRESLQSYLGMRSANLQTLYLGIDTDFFVPKGPKQPQVFTAARITRDNLRRKGLQTYIDAARLVPDIPYRLAGRPVDQDVVDEIEMHTSSNLDYLGYIDRAQLLAEYQQACVYAQLSMHEGFGMAMAEAMSCGCVPVVTNKGAIPEVVGDTGLYVPLEDPQAASEAIRKIVESADDVAGQRARQRIVDRFRLSRRKDELQAILESLF